MEEPVLQIPAIAGKYFLAAVDRKRKTYQNYVCKWVRRDLLTNRRNGAVGSAFAVTGAIGFLFDIFNQLKSKQEKKTNNTQINYNECTTYDTTNVIKRVQSLTLLLLLA